jgi:hypothetical protein
MKQSEVVAMKQAAAELIALVGGVEAASAATRVNAASIRQAIDPDKPNQLPADVVLDLESAAGRPVVTAALARLAGYRLEPKPPSQMVDLTAVAEPAMAAELTARLGEVAQAARAASPLLGGSLGLAQLEAMREALAAFSDYADQCRDELRRRLQQPRDRRQPRAIEPLA